MTGNEPTVNHDWVDPDDAPDLSTPEWREAFASVPVRRGRPPVLNPKEHVSLRLDVDVMKALRRSGPDWRKRVNDTLRAAFVRDGT